MIPGRHRQGGGPLTLIGPALVFAGVVADTAGATLAGVLLLAAGIIASCFWPPNLEV